MTRIEQLESVNNYILGIGFLLNEFIENDTWPSPLLMSARGHITKAQNEIKKEISNLKQMKK